MTQEKEIYCCGCGEEVKARLTNGAEIYQHRADLHALPFWKCDACGNYVGCHHKTKDPTRPLGNIPTGEIRKARGYIHAILDPMWQHTPREHRKRMRTEIYAKLSEKMGREYHTADIRTIEEAREVYRAVKEMVEAA